MKRVDKVAKMLNWILSIIYIPISFFSWLLTMASEGTIDATNPFYINLINAFCFIAFSVPLLCVAGISVSILLRKKGRNSLSIIIQFLPLVVFILNVILLAFTESLPATL